MMASESVRAKIRDIIGAEDPQKPLSDQAISQMLRLEGIDIARRTVAKYREAMKILPSSRRKKIT
jgi:RNA polymerase sigma-54 factor